MKAFKYFTIIFLFIFVSILSLTGCERKHNVLHIGIVLPIEHQALNEIVDGFKTTMQRLKPRQQFAFKVANAQGDMNMQRAIIEQMRDGDCAMIIPVGTTTTQMTSSIVERKPIVALAALFSDKERQVRKYCNVAVVDDEINNAQIIDFIHRVYPDLRRVALVYSPSDKIFPEIVEVKTAANNHNIEVHPFMITNLSELYAISQSLPASIQAIFILKDNMIVSGIDTLIAVAKERHIPLITSDEATVEKGAAFALGVHEKKIGEEGAKLAAQILEGKHACQLPIVKMIHPTIFINLLALSNGGLEQQQIKSIAQQLHLPVEIVNLKNSK